MEQALNLARQGLGRVAPNPAVGCVLVKDGQVISQSRTADGGRPHAEACALEVAGEAARGATAYVTLEPCAHEGETPSCAKTLVRAGVSRVAVACCDPDPRTAGQGIQILKDAGIGVIEGICEKEALDLNKGFFLKITETRPLVTLKMALSADNKIAAKAGVRTQISGAEGSKYMHQLRSQHDAILVGMGTVIADDPMLTARVDGINHRITRVVLGAKDRMPEGCKLIQTQDQYPLTIIETHDIKTVLADLTARGITRLMVEGGAQIMQAFIGAGYGDELHILRAPKLIGEQGLSVNLNLSSFTLTEKCSIGEDMLEIYTREA